MRVEHSRHLGRRGSLPGPSFLKRHSFRIWRFQRFSKDLGRACHACPASSDYGPLAPSCYYNGPKITAPPGRPIRNDPNGLFSSLRSPLPSNLVPLPISTISSAHQVWNRPTYLPTYSLARSPSNKVLSLLCLPRCIPQRYPSSPQSSLALRSPTLVP